MNNEKMIGYFFPFNKIKFLIFGLVCSLFQLTANAQYGIKAGIAISSFYYVQEGPDPNLSFDVDLRPYLEYDIEWVQLNDQKPLISPYIGVYFIHKLGKRLSLQPELCFNQKGVSFNQATYEKITYEVQISYLELPVMVAYSLIKRERIVSEIKGGIYGALTLDARKKVESFHSGLKVTPLENANNFIAGITFGLNVKYKVEKSYVSIDLRAFIDMNDALFIPEDQVAIYHQIQKIRNTGLFLTMAYEF